MKNQDKPAAKPESHKSQKKNSASTQTHWPEEHIKNLDENTMQAALFFKEFVQQQDHSAAENNQNSQLQRSEQKNLQHTAMIDAQTTQNFCLALQKNHHQAKFDVIMPPFGQFSVKTHAQPAGKGVDFMIYDASSYTQNFIATHHAHLCKNLSSELQQPVTILLED